MFNTRQILIILLTWFGLSFLFGLISLGTPMGDTDFNAIITVFSPFFGSASGASTAFLSPTWWGGVWRMITFQYPIFLYASWLQYFQWFLWVCSLAILIGMLGQIATIAGNVLGSIAGLFTGR